MNFKPNKHEFDKSFIKEKRVICIGENELRSFGKKEYYQGHWGERVLT